MSRLRIFEDNRPEQYDEFSTLSEIQTALHEINIRFERWETGTRFESTADPTVILAQFSPEIDQLKQANGYVTADVISVTPASPNLPTLRAKFLQEHTHSEDEVRYFVRGAGLFCIHANGQVYAMRCESNDLISVPAGTKHWFDMGEFPDFTCVRLFCDPSGWVADYTGSTIANLFPRMD